MTLCRGVSFAIGIFLVPFILGHLGKDDYGLFSLLRSVMGYLPLVTIAIGPALARYVTHALARNDNEAINRYMSTGLFAFAGLSVLVVAVGGVIAWQLPVIFDLGNRPAESQILMFLLVLSFIASYTMGLFSAPLFARERLMESTLLQTLSDIVRAAVIVLAFLAISPSLRWLGAGSLVGTVVSAIAMTISGFVVFPWLRLSWRWFDRKALNELISFSFFSTLGVLVHAIYFSTDNLLIKWLWGEDDTVQIAVYSVAAMWDPWMRTAAQPLVRVITPRLTMMAALDQTADLKRVTLIAIRYATAIIAPMCVFLSVFAEPILTLWLGDRLTAEEHRTAAGLMPIFLIPLTLAMGTSPAQAVYIARGKIAIPSLSGLVSAISNLILSVVLVRYAGWGLYGIAAGTGITVAVRAILFVPFYLRIIIGIRIRELVLRAVGPPMVLTGIIGVAMLSLQMFLKLQALAPLVGVFIASMVVYSVGAWWAVVLPDDRRRVLSRLGRRG